MKPKRSKWTTEHVLFFRGLTLLALVTSVFLASPVEGAGVLKVTPSNVNFGTLDEGALASTTFILENISSASAVIASVQTN
jgi:hypothetical protein